MPSLFSALQAVLRRWFGHSGQTVAVSDYSAEHTAESDSTLQVEEHDGSPTHLVPYDENLLERSRTQWQFGDWESLAQLSRDTLQHHPDRAKLALLAAAGLLQTGETAVARQYIRLAQDWGVSKKLISQILIAGVHNSLGRAAAVGGQEQRALRHFENAIATGMPGGDVRLLTEARVATQINQFVKISPAIHHLIIDKFRSQIKCFGHTSCEKKVIRVIHHMACTGGTLFSKCIAALPNVVVLNEINPFSKMESNDLDKVDFRPRDILSLLKQSGSYFNDSTTAEIFCNDIAVILNTLDKQGRHLVLREHTHSVYMFGEIPPIVKSTKDALSPYYKIVSLITVRNPIDSYLSLKEFGWVHFEPKTFEEYCRRYLLFLADYKGIPIIRYEDFVEDYHSVMRKICEFLSLKYEREFENRFYNFKFSGDSGRKGSLIAPRPRRQYDIEFVKEVNESKSYKELCIFCGYNSSFE